MLQRCPALSFWPRSSQHRSWLETCRRRSDRDSPHSSGMSAGLQVRGMAWPRPLPSEHPACNRRLGRQNQGRCVGGRTARANQAQAVAASQMSYAHDLRDELVGDRSGGIDVKAYQSLDLHAGPGRDAGGMRIEHQTVQAPEGVPGDQDAPGGSATVKLSPRSPSPGDQGQVGVSQARQDEGFVNRGSDQSTNDSGGHPV